MGRQPGASPVAGGVGRWLRGGVVGLSATALAVAGHAVEGGPAAAPVTTAGLAALALLASVGLSRVRWNLPTLLGILVGAQAIFHLALGGPSALGNPWPSWTAVAAHGAAALATALVLRRGEDACWRLADLLARPLRAARTRAARTGVVAPPARWAASDVVRTPGSRLVDAAPRRGPPSASAA